MRILADYGIGLFAFLVLAAWWVARSQRNGGRGVTASLWAATGTVIAVALNQLVVSAVHRPRPYQRLHGVEVLVARSHDFSFPSDHAVAAGAAAAGLWLIALHGTRPSRGLALVGTILAVVVAFSRVYVGAHYPGDVAVGLILGGTITTLGWLVVQRPAVRIVTSIGRLGFLRLLVQADEGTHTTVGAA